MKRFLDKGNNAWKIDKSVSKKQTENTILFMIIYTLHYSKCVPKSMYLLSVRRYSIAIEEDIL